MQVKSERVERRRHAQERVNRTHIRAFLDKVRDYDDIDEMPEPRDAKLMRPHVFGQEAAR